MMSKADSSCSTSIPSLKHRNKSSLLFTCSSEARSFCGSGKELEKLASNMEFTLNLHLQYRIASFFTCIRSDAVDINPGSPFASMEGKGRINKVLESWTNYRVGKTNTIYKRQTNFSNNRVRPLLSKVH